MSFRISPIGIIWRLILFMTLSTKHAGKGICSTLTQKINQQSYILKLLWAILTHTYCYFIFMILQQTKVFRQRNVYNRWVIPYIKVPSAPQNTSNMHDKICEAFRFWLLTVRQKHIIIAQCPIQSLNPMYSH